MKISANEMKAIAWYALDRGLRPQLSTPPRMYFTNNKGEEVKVDLPNIVTEHKAWNEQDKKERARAKLEVAKKNEAAKARTRITW